eukprot:s449_g42.t1
MLWHKDVMRRVLHMDFTLSTLLALAPASTHCRDVLLDTDLWKGFPLAVYPCDCWRKLCPNACMLALRLCSALPGEGMAFVPPSAGHGQVHKIGNDWKARDNHGKFNFWWMDALPVFSVQIDLKEELCALDRRTLTLGLADWADPLQRIHEIIDGSSPSFALVHLRLSRGRATCFQWVCSADRHKLVRGRRDVDFSLGALNFTFLLTGVRLALFDSDHVLLCEALRSSALKPRTRFCCISAPVPPLPLSWPGGSGERIQESQPCFSQGSLFSSLITQTVLEEARAEML